MCGRARCSASRERLEQFVGSQFGCSKCLVDDSMSAHYSPSYNISPGYYLPVIVKNSDNEGRIELSAFKWGLVPNFTTKSTQRLDHYKMFNCRSEEMQNKASFKNLIARNRCIVLTEGFYEWKSQHFGDKQPYYVYFTQCDADKDDKNEIHVDIMPMAGLYDCWVDRNNRRIYTCTILTTSSSKELSWLHDRMPLILSQEDMKSWIDTKHCSISKQLLMPYHGTKPLRFHKVTPKIGKVSFQGEACCAVYGKSQKSILSMFHVKKEEDEQKTTEDSINTVLNAERKRKIEKEDFEGEKKSRAIT